MATDWRRLLTARDVEFGGFVDVNVMVNRDAGRRHSIGAWLRALADRLDGRESLALEFECRERFSGEPIALTRADVVAAVHAGMRETSRAVIKLAIERRIDAEMLRARPELREASERGSP